MPGVSLERSSDYAETLREAIARNVFVTEEPSPGEPPLNIGGVITCSVGVASLEKGGGKEAKKIKEKLIRESDAAMYRAKDLGKNRISLAGDSDASGPNIA